MIRTPYHALLSRHDYDLLRRFNPDALWKVHWIEERPEALGPTAPVRLFYRTPELKTENQLEILRALSLHRQKFTATDDTD